MVADLATLATTRTPVVDIYNAYLGYGSSRSLARQLAIVDRAFTQRTDTDHWRRRLNNPDLPKAAASDPRTDALVRALDDFTTLTGMGLANVWCALREGEVQRALDLFRKIRNDYHPGFERRVLADEEAREAWRAWVDTHPEYNWSFDEWRYLRDGGDGGGRGDSLSGEVAHRLLPHSPEGPPPECEIDSDYIRAAVAEVASDHPDVIERYLLAVLRGDHRETALYRWSMCRLANCSCDPTFAEFAARWKTYDVLVSRSDQEWACLCECDCDSCSAARCSCERCPCGDLRVIVGPHSSETAEDCPSQPCEGERAPWQRRASASHEVASGGPEVKATATKPPKRAAKPRGQVREYKLASEYTPGSPEWLWWHRIALGAVSILNGDPNLGKSTVTLDWAARVSTGRPFWGESGSSASVEPAGVLVVSAEDAIETTILPRLIAAGADLERVAFTELPLDNEGRPLPLTVPEDLDRIERTINAIGARLVIIDPIAAYLGPDISTNNDSSVRRALSPLSHVAESTGAAIVLVRHLNKDSSKKAMYRGGGSIGFTAASRAEMVINCHPDDPTLRVVAWLKSNLAPGLPESVGFRIESSAENPEVAQVHWTDVDSIDADRLLRGDDARKKSPALEEAQAILADLVTEPMLVTDVKAAVDGSGISWDTFNRARRALGFHSERIYEEGKIKGWQWTPPGKLRLSNATRTKKNT